MTRRMAGCCRWVRQNLVWQQKGLHDRNMLAQCSYHGNRLLLPASTPPFTCMSFGRISTHTQTRSSSQASVPSSLSWRKRAEIMTDPWTDRGRGAFKWCPRGVSSIQGDPFTSKTITLFATRGCLIRRNIEAGDESVVKTTDSFSGCTIHKESVAKEHSEACATACRGQFATEETSTRTKAQVLVCRPRVCCVRLITQAFRGHSSQNNCQFLYLSRFGATKRCTPQNNGETQRWRCIFH